MAAMRGNATRLRNILLNVVEFLAAFALKWEGRAKGALRWNIIEQTAIDITDGDPTLQDFRDVMFRPLAMTFTKMGVSAAHISIAGLTFAIIASIYTELAGVFVLCLFANMLCDGLDGVIARHQNTDSDAGAVMDVGCDTLSIAFVIAGLYAHDQIPLWLMLGFGVVIATYTFLSMVKSKLLCGIFRSVGSRIFTFFGLAALTVFPTLLSESDSYSVFLTIIAFGLSFSLVLESLRSRLNWSRRTW